MTPDRDSPEPPAPATQPPATRSTASAASAWRAADDHDRDQYRIAALLELAHPREQASEILLGVAATRARIEAAFLSIPKESLSISPPVHPLVLHDLTPEDRASTVTMLRGGTRSSWISDDSAGRVPEIRAHMEILHQHGEAIHLAPRVSQRMFIIDRQFAFVPLDPAETGRGALLIRSAAAVAGLVDLFHEILARSTPLATRPTMPTLRHDVLALLARGSKDDAIARRLGLSPRTVRRVVAALMTESGADSRFQLAIAAVQLGWLTAEDLAPAPHLPVDNSAAPAHRLT